MTQKAFTLIELSITLVIIGLIVGGVLVGQDLMRAAQLRSLSKQVEQIDAAVNTFRLKYNCLAGDCANATTFFQTSANGDGGKYVGSRAAGTATQRKEHWNFWQHLALAGLIEGSYTGDGSAGDQYMDATIGENVPATAISGAGIDINAQAPQLTTWNNNYGALGSVTEQQLVIGGDSNTAYSTFEGKVPVIDAKSLDDKLDDGVASDGRFRVYLSAASLQNLGCTSGAAPNFSYSLTDTSSPCVLMFFKKW